MKTSNFIYKMFMLKLFFISLVSCYLFLSSILLNKTIFIEWELMSLNSVSMVMSLLFDWMTFSFLMVVSLISSMMMLYAIYYMEGDLNFKRFTLILYLFVLSMMFLIISPNLVSLLLGWDGLGLTSYALVIYYQNESSCNSGMITVLSNRVGDSALLVCIGLSFYKCSWNFFMFNKIDSILLMLVCLAAITKSAQIPFSAWLPAAMAAPTPVSALVHSSTLVTAGVYLLIRFAPLIHTKTINCFCLLVGVLTMLMAGWVANFETDLKKVIALSTLSQLGLMFMTLGLGQPKLAFFHLLMHAMFKSSLFMCAGFLIHNLKGSQDSRFAGSLISSSPYLSLLFSVTNLALCGFPFLTGFFSKDLILEMSVNTVSGVFMIILIILATGFTVSYSLRVFFLAMMNMSKMPAVNYSMDFPFILIFSTAILFLLSIFGGYFFSILMLKSGLVCDLYALEKFFVLMILVASIFLTSQFLSSKKTHMMTNWFLMWVSSIMMFLPVLTSFLTAKMIFNLNTAISKHLDKGWLEFYGPLGMKDLFSFYSKTNQFSQMTLIFTQYMSIFLLILVFSLFLL